MAEFVADFRAAHFSLFGAGDSDITIEQLADVVDRVALPIPDTRLLSDLFLDMDAALGTGRVPFSAFLARMSYRIAGKYHLDVVRAIFFALAKLCLPESRLAELERELEAVDGLSALMDHEQAVRSAAADSGPTSPGPSPVSGKAYPAASAATGRAAVDATMVKSGAAHNTIRVQIAALVEVTLRGIGLRLTAAGAEELLLRQGTVPAHGSVEMNILDLAKFLSAATAQVTAAFTPACSVNQVPSVGADLNELAVEARE